MKSSEDKTRDFQLKLRAQEEELRTLSLQLQETEKEYQTCKSQSHTSIQTVEERYASQLNKSMQKVFDHQSALQEKEALLAESMQKYRALEEDTQQKIRSMMEENEHKIRVLVEENDQKQRTLQEEWEQICRSAEESSVHKLQSSLLDNERRCQTLEAENEKLRSNQQAFEEYKSRAQKTLKQANTNTTNLNSKVIELEEEIRSKEKIIQNLTEDLRLSKMETDRLRNQITELR
jgi:chromosome segregation ATPase